MSADGRSILIVDDDDVLRPRLARAFAARGLDARAAADGEEALASTRGWAPDLAVVDLRMPGRSGLEVLRELLAAHPATRVLILTGYASVSTAVDAMRLGAVGYLPKPADADDVLAAFARAEAPPLAAATDDLPAPSLARAEWEHIDRVLTECGGNISQAARRLGIHRRTLQRKLGKDPPRS